MIARITEESDRINARPAPQPEQWFHVIVNQRWPDGSLSAAFLSEHEVTGWVRAMLAAGEIRI